MAREGKGRQEKGVCKKGDRVWAYYDSQLGWLAAIVLGDERPIDDGTVLDVKYCCDGEEEPVQTKLVIPRASEASASQSPFYSKVMRNAAPEDTASQKCLKKSKPSAKRKAQQEDVEEQEEVCLMMPCLITQLLLMK